MPRPPPGLWTALRVAYREGLSRLSGGTQAPPKTVRDLNYRHITSQALKHVVRSVAKPLPAAAEPAVAGGARSHSALRPPFDLGTRTFTSLAGRATHSSPAPLRRGAHLGGSPPVFRSSVPKTAQVGLQLHTRGLHAGPARQVLQNVVENAPLGVRSLWEVEWKKQKSQSRAATRSGPTAAAKENVAIGVKSAKVEKLAVRPETVVSEVAGTEAFERFFPPTAPAAPLKATSLVYVPLTLPSLETDWTDLASFSSLYAPSPIALSHPLLPPTILKALRSHVDSSQVHTIRLRSLFDRLSSTAAENQVKDAWIEAGNYLVLRVDRDLAVNLRQGRSYWLRVEDESPIVEDAESPDDRIHRWRRFVEPSSMQPPRSFAEDASDSLWSSSSSQDPHWIDTATGSLVVLDAITHDRVASRVVLPVPATSASDDHH